MLAERARRDRSVRGVSSPAYYSKKLQRPIWPGEQSGVTIGIGYDLGVTSRSQIEADWRAHLNDSDLDLLRVAQGVTGESARQLAKGLSSVVIPFDMACTVFYQSTLPLYARRTRDTYPARSHCPRMRRACCLADLQPRHQAHWVPLAPKWRRSNRWCEVGSTTSTRSPIRSNPWCDCGRSPGLERPPPSRGTAHSHGRSRVRSQRDRARLMSAIPQE